MAAVLTCGPGAVLSHESAAALWEMRPETDRRIHVTVPAHLQRDRPGVVVHRRNLVRVEMTRRRGIPVTSPASALVDLATCHDRAELEAAINEADKRGVIDPERLRLEIERLPPRLGVVPLRATLDHRTFTLTDSELERRFLPIAERAGLPKPETGKYVNGFKVDFWWPDLGLVVETDGLRYHRTPAQQARDHLRDQTHIAAGLTPVRFTRAQVTFDSDYVGSTLAAIARNLRLADRGSSAQSTT